LNAHQYEINLPPGATNDALSEQLADRVERFNASTDADERVVLHREVIQLRELVGRVGDE